MTKYIFYLRTNHGDIERLEHLITSPIEGLLGTYKYQQALENFPETTVFWDNEKGVSVGIAPIIPDLPRREPNSQETSSSSNA